MRRGLKANFVWMIAVALGIMSFAGNCLADIPDARGHKRGAVREIVQSSAPLSYGVVYGDDRYEKISSVDWRVEGGKVYLTITVSLSDEGCDTDDSSLCWLNGGSMEYLTVYVDWDKSGDFYPCWDRSIQEKSVSDHSDQELMFDMEFDVPDKLPESWCGIWTRIYLTHDKTAPCGGKLGWGDVWDQSMGNVPDGDFYLSNSTVDENSVSGIEIGKFFVCDGQGNDSSHSYKLVSGHGDDDNPSFFLWAGTFYANGNVYFDYDTQSEHSVRVWADDGKGNTHEKEFAITVNEMEEFEISGCVVDENAESVFDGQGVQGITVNLYSDKNFIDSVTTDSSGSYNFYANKGSAYRVKPSRAGYRFDPPSYSYENMNSERKDQIFKAKPPKDITGYVFKWMDDHGRMTGLGGAEVNFSNDPDFGSSVRTDNAGYFSMMVGNGWSGWITPSMNKYIFEPEGIFYKDLTSDRPINFFTGSPPDTHMGWVFRETDGGYEKFEGVTVKLGDGSDSTVTDSSGAYTLNAPHEWEGEIVPVMTGYTFELYDHLFPYPIYVAKGPRLSGIRLDIYAEDTWEFSRDKRPKVYKAPGDLLDIVVRITNDAVVEQNGITPRLIIDAGKVSDFLRVYLRVSPEWYFWPSGNHFQVPSSFYEDETDGEGRRIITIEPAFNILTDFPDPRYFEFVFRFEVNENLESGAVSAEVIAEGESIATTSARLDENGSGGVEIVKGKDVILTTRSLMYRTFRGKEEQIAQLWTSLYEIAEEREAVVYHVDKYDLEGKLDENDDREENITISWFDDRQNLNDVYGDDVKSNDDPGRDPNDDEEEEGRVNKVAIKIKKLLKSLIDNSGGLGDGRYVAILGGDSVIPFYRAYDPSENVLENKGGHSATDITKTDARNNYLFTDMFYRDYDGDDWKKGGVENVFVGRVTGTSPEDMERLLLSSNSTESVSKNVVKLEITQFNCELNDFQGKSEEKGYFIIDNIDGTAIDYSSNGKCYSGGIVIGEPPKDPAGWDNEFLPFFTGQASFTSDDRSDKIENFDIMRILAHGSVSGVSGTGNNNPFFRGANLREHSNYISKYFSAFKPFFIFDSCLVGIVDGQNQNHLLNALLPLNVRGILANSAVGVTGDHGTVALRDEFYSYLLFDDEGDELGAGKALCQANKKWMEDLREPRYLPNRMFAELEANLFGLPWAAVEAPNLRDKKRRKADKRNGITSSDIRSDAENTYTRVMRVDASDYEIERFEYDGNLFDLVHVDRFSLDGLETIPMIPSGYGIVEFSIPHNAEIRDVKVGFANPVDLGQLNIPALHRESLGGNTYPLPCPDIGIYPDRQYSYGDIDFWDHKSFTFTMSPMTHNTNTKETTLYTGIDIEVTYTTPHRGFATGPFSNGSIFSVNGDISAQTRVRNTSADSHEFGVTMQIREDNRPEDGHVFSTETVRQVIGSGESEYVTVKLRAPDIDDGYELVMTVSDGTNIIGTGSRGIGVIGGKLVSFMAPDVIYEGTCGDFVVEFENAYHVAADAFIDIIIYDRDRDPYYPIVELLPMFAEIPSGETKKISVPWAYLGNRLPPGTYEADVTVKMNGEAYGTWPEPNPEFVLISPLTLKHAVLALRTAAGMGEGNADCPDVNCDGKTGADDAAMILRVLAGMK